MSATPDLLLTAHPGDMLVFHAEQEPPVEVLDELSVACLEAGVKMIVLTGDLTVAAVHRCEAP